MCRFLGLKRLTKAVPVVLSSNLVPIEGCGSALLQSSEGFESLGSSEQVLLSEEAPQQRLAKSVKPTAVVSAAQGQESAAAAEERRAQPLSSGGDGIEVRSADAPPVSAGNDDFAKNCHHCSGCQSHAKCDCSMIFSHPDGRVLTAPSAHSCTGAGSIGGDSVVSAQSTGKKAKKNNRKGKHRGLVLRVQGGQNLNGIRVRTRNMKDVTIQVKP